MKKITEDKKLDQHKTAKFFFMSRLIHTKAIKTKISAFKSTNFNKFIFLCLLKIIIIIIF